MAGTFAGAFAEAFAATCAGESAAICVEACQLVSAVAARQPCRYHQTVTRWVVRR